MIHSIETLLIAKDWKIFQRFQRFLKNFNEVLFSSSNLSSLAPLTLSTSLPDSLFIINENIDMLIAHSIGNSRTDFHGTSDVYDFE